MNHKNIKKCSKAMAMHHNGNPTMWNYKFFIPLFKLDAHSCTTTFYVPFNKFQYPLRTHHSSCKQVGDHCTKNTNRSTWHNFIIILKKKTLLGLGELNQLIQPFKHSSHETKQTPTLPPSHKKVEGYR